MFGLSLKTSPFLLTAHLSPDGAKIGLYIFNKYGQEKYYEFHNKLMSEAGRAMKDRKDYTPSNLAAPSMV